MGKRVLAYALIYGCIGAVLGAFLAIYTNVQPPSSVVLKNGSATKARQDTASRTPTDNAEVAESSTPSTARED